MYPLIPLLVLAAGCSGTAGAAGAAGASGSARSDGVDGAAGRDGVDGADGQDGADGAPGRDGVDAAATYHWADANGTDVTVSTDLVRFDANGYAWSISTGPVGVLGPGSETTVVYGDARCSGAQFVPGSIYGTTAYAAPRMPLLIDGAYYVAPDSPSYVNGATSSWYALSGTTCVDLTSAYGATSDASSVSDGSTYQFIAVSRLTRIDPPPTADWTGPLHMVAGTGTP